MPDYKLRLWDASSFDFGSVPFVKEAYGARKWAFVADYLRLYALYTEGGIYLDSDVRVFRRFDPFLKYDFFTSHEFHPLIFDAAERRKLDLEHRPIKDDQLVYGLNVQAAIMGGAKGNPFLKDCLSIYEGRHFFGPDGKVICNNLIIGPYMSKVAERYGYRYHPREQSLAQNMVVLGPEVFVGNSIFFSKESYALHMINGSWTEKTSYGEIRYWIRNHFPRIFPLVAFCEKVLWKLGVPIRLQVDDGRQ